MPREQIAIKTPDGTCHSWVFTPEGKGPWPAVILYPDAFAIRPALIEHAQRLADGGYVVLVPDPFYRMGSYEAMNPKTAFSDPDFRKKLGVFFASTGNAKSGKDTESYLAYLDTRKDIKGAKIGTVGYCMGGGMAITAAGTYPDRVAAAASFHGGNLATDAEDSPHRLAPKIKAKLYIGVADNDATYPPEMGERFERALKDAHVDYTSELYKGALHGWTQTDFNIYDHDAAEEHWRKLFALYAATLK